MRLFFSILILFSLADTKAAFSARPVPPSCPANLVHLVKAKELKKLVQNRLREPYRSTHNVELRGNFAADFDAVGVKNLPFVRHLRLALLKDAIDETSFDGSDVMPSVHTIVQGLVEGSNAVPDPDNWARGLLKQARETVKFQREKAKREGCYGEAAEGCRPALLQVVRANRDFYAVQMVLSYMASRDSLLLGTGQYDRTAEAEDIANPFTEDANRFQFTAWSLAIAGEENRIERLLTGVSTEVRWWPGFSSCLGPSNENATARDDVTLREANRLRVNLRHFRVLDQVLENLK